MISKRGVCVFCVLMWRVGVALTYGLLGMCGSRLFTPSSRVFLFVLAETLQHSTLAILVSFFQLARLGTRSVHCFRCFSFLLGQFHGSCSRLSFVLSYL